MDMNAYYQVINNDAGTALRLVPATGSGKSTIDVQELIEYLTINKVPFQLKELGAAVTNLTEERMLKLSMQRSLPIQESIHVSITDMNMTVVCSFIPPSSDGKRLGKSDIMSSLSQKKITYGIDEAAIDAFLESPVYLEDVVMAKGLEPRHGTDARIEYYFNTDLKARPTLNEDGSVDFFNLNIINHCEKDELLARLYPEDRGDDGCDVLGNRIKPRTVKHDILRFGKNIRQSEDKTELYATGSGSVSLIEGRVFVSTTMEVENVDTATGNIVFDGDVVVNGNVCSNFSVKATGNVEVRGVVEGADIEAGGNITIARGMNGMSKGTLRAKGNIIAKFIENASAQANGYVEAGSLMHSTIMAGTEVHVDGRRGFISGGHVSATSLVSGKILGSEMGTDTVIEVGISPVVKKRYKELLEIEEDDSKIIERAVPILEAARDKYLAGKELSDTQIENVRSLAEVVKEKRATLAAVRAEIDELDMIMTDEKQAQVIVEKVIYPGTKIVISDVSKIIKESVQYCRFIRYQGDVKMVGMN